MNWSVIVPLHAVARGPVRHDLLPDDRQRSEAAELLSVPAIPALTADVVVTSWLDGCEVQGRWQATVTQTCGLTLDDFDTDLSGEFVVKAVPAGSANAPSEDPEVEIDPEGDDPPDVLPASEVDVAAYVVEHLALELDPFPRKPGAEFDAPEPENPVSPFAALSRLKPQ
jgi:uncharacterized metal-binding protein YceD (DUF177 family)